MVAAGGRQFEYSFMDYSPESSPERENGPDNGFDFQEFSREHEPDRVSIRVWKIFIHLTSDIVAVKLVSFSRIIRYCWDVSTIFLSLCLVCGRCLSSCSVLKYWL